MATKPVPLAGKSNQDSDETQKLTAGETAPDMTEEEKKFLIGQIADVTFSSKLDIREYENRVDAANLYDPFAIKGDKEKAELHSAANRLREDDYSVWAKLPMRTILDKYYQWYKLKKKQPKQSPDNIKPTEKLGGTPDNTVAPANSGVVRQETSSQDSKNPAEKSTVDSDKYDPNFMVSEGKVCNCCGYADEHEGNNIKSFENPYSYRAGGAGYVMFFKLNVVNLAVIGSLCVVNIYKLLVNIFGGYCVSAEDTTTTSYKDSGDLPVCYIDWVTIHSAANYGVKNIDYAERYLLLIMFLINSIYLAAGNYYISYIADWIDGRDLNASDYAVLIKGVAREFFTQKNKKDNLLGKVIERIGVQVTPEALKLGQTDQPLGIKVVHIDYIYNYFEFSRTYERLSELKRYLNEQLVEEAIIEDSSLQTITKDISEASTRKRFENPKTGKESVTMSSCAIIKKALLPMFNTLNMPKFQPQTYERMSLEFQLQFIETIYLNDKLISMRQSMESNDPHYYRGAVIVSFEQREHMVRFLKEMERFSPTDGYETLNGLAMVSFRSIVNSFKEKSGLNKFNVRRAAHPDEIVWRNTGVTAVRKGLMVILSLAALVLLIGITIGALYLLKRAQQEGKESEKARYRTYSGTITAVIVVVNFIIGYLVVFLSRYEMESNMAVTVKSIFVRVILVGFHLTIRVKVSTPA